jgi:Glycosyltransferases involved in cell wall biogenesis
VEKSMPDCIDITIMMTCYNERDLVVASIETVVSALEQSTLTWELIVVDDVSSDDSVVQIQGYIDAHPDRPVRLHRNAVNRGLANNFVDGAFMGKGSLLPDVLRG